MHGDAFTASAPPLDIRASMLISLCDLPADHPLIHGENARFDLASDYRPAGDKAESDVAPRRRLRVDGEEFAPFAQATISASFTAARNLNNWIVQINGKPDAAAIFRALQERADNPILLYAESPAGQRLCGAFKIASLTEIASRGPARQEWMITLSQLSKTAAGWY